MVGSVKMRAVPFHYKRDTCRQGDTMTTTPTAQDINGTAYALFCRHNDGRLGLFRCPGCKQEGIQASNEGVRVMNPPHSTDIVLTNDPDAPGHELAIVDPDEPEPDPKHQPDSKTTT